MWVEGIFNAYQNGYLSSKRKKAAERFASTVKTAAHTGFEGQKLKLSAFLSYLTDVRKAVVKRFENTEATQKDPNFLEDLLAVFTVNKTEKKAILEAQEAYREGITKRTGVELTDTAEPTASEELTPIFEHTELIKEAQSIIQIERAKSAPSYLKMACALMLLTGRRATEILKTGEFEAIPNEPKRLLFKGQLKVKKRAEKEDFKDTYVIPTLCEASQILEDFKAMREASETQRAGKMWQGQEVLAFADMDNDDVGVTTANVLGQYARRFFGNWLGANISSHNLRKAYLAIARHEYVAEFAQKMQAFERAQSQPAKGKKSQKTTAHPPVLDSVEKFARNILGHAGGNDNGEKIVDLTTRTYLFYKVVTTAKPETLQPTIPTQSEGIAATESKNLSVPLRIIELLKPVLNDPEKELLSINQYTIQNLFFKQYQKRPDYISMDMVLTGKVPPTDKELKLGADYVEPEKRKHLKAAVLDASKRIEEYNKAAVLAKAKRDADAKAAKKQAEKDAQK